MMRQSQLRVARSAMLLPAVPKRWPCSQTQLSLS
jgi:hypothetical protein